MATFFISSVVNPLIIHLTIKKINLMDHRNCFSSQDRSGILYIIIEMCKDPSYVLSFSPHPPLWNIRISFEII